MTSSSWSPVVMRARLIAAAAAAIAIVAPAALGGPAHVDTGAPLSQAAVGKQQAAQTARRFIQRRFGQPARVTGITREDDFGARWEVEVTRRDGAEYDVYVTARGTVVRVVRGPVDD